MKSASCVLALRSPQLQTPQTNTQVLPSGLGQTPGSSKQSPQQDVRVPLPAAMSRNAEEKGREQAEETLGVGE